MGPVDRQRWVYAASKQLLERVIHAHGLRGELDYTVVRPTMSFTKEAWNDARTAEISGNVFPGDFIQYKIIVENTGTADASGISITDALPAEVTYDSTSGDGGSPSWGISEATGTVTGTLTTLPVGATRFFWVRVQIK